MKYIYYLFITIILLSIIIYLSIFNLNMFYKNVNNSLIGLPVSKIEDVIGEKVLADFSVKGFIGFPYKVYDKGCGTGYSLTVYYNENKIVTSASNKVFYMCDGIYYFSKRVSIKNDGTTTYVSLWPFAF